MLHAVGAGSSGPDAGSNGTLPKLVFEWGKETLVRSQTARKIRI
jgi:hypothetical protein